jgi:hypothetical protein
MAMSQTGRLPGIGTVLLFAVDRIEGARSTLKYLRRYFEARSQTRFGLIFTSVFCADNDGLVQVPVLVYPDPLKEWRYVDQIPDQEARATFHNLAYQIARTDFFDEVNGLEEVKGKKCFSFDDEGQEAFIEWLTELEKRLKEFDEPIIIQHLAKYRKLMPALALIFHVITIAGKENKTGKIPKESVIRAICWCEYLESHARCIYGMVK